MAKVYNVVFPHSYNVQVGNRTETRTEMVRVGAAFPMKDKDGFSIELSVPLMLGEGGKLLLFVRESDDRGNDNDRNDRNGNGNGNGNRRR